MIPTENNILGRILRLPLRLIPKDKEVGILRGPLKGARWIVGSFNHGGWLGTFEADKLELFAEVVRPGMCVYDIGANVGLYTLLGSRCVGPEGEVYAFEPLPRNLKYLRAHVAANDCQNVKVFEEAVGDRDGMAAFDDTTHESHAMGRLAEGGRLPVKVVRLDNFARRQNLRPPHAIKMDIEGGENAALRGMTETLRRHKPTILLATHGAEVHRECVELLASLGYEMTEVGSPDELLCRVR